ncbi:hypothetical protein POSPLADRAFT_1046372 [Postia placenta MAD-698-R-SB12]|uniref:Uncharacterized protein n=1 Tax=Postia placenta MAD-698-R-SB12 TaxID=670580 RepID=A0A1X6N329_9APHY|nr:hypothetical protein POSPLADRAFT_1046372 [Postia placenta MAD-698-R-SB12]OSX63029.1 hypothetical protein POSPLADRAFT_1046372 [Postia placenta MAD-698-R-SB12]
MPAELTKRCREYIHTTKRSEHEDTSQDTEKFPLDKPCQSWGFGESEARRAINRKCADSGRTRTHARYRYGILKSGTETDQDGARPKAGDVQTPAIRIEVGTKLVEAFKEPRLQGEATTQEAIRHMV